MMSSTSSCCSACPVDAAGEASRLLEEEVGLKSTRRLRRRPRRWLSESLEEAFSPRATGGGDAGGGFEGAPAAEEAASLRRGAAELTWRTGEEFRDEGPLCCPSLELREPFFLPRRLLRGVEAVGAE